MPAYYLIAVSDSDGNDNTITDYIVRAESAYAACCAALDAAKYEDDEEDGGFGTYHACQCDNPEDCDGHGGILVHEGSIEEYQTEKEADAARRFYHCNGGILVASEA